jgi:hypothetical protein
VESGIDAQMISSFIQLIEQEEKQAYRNLVARSPLGQTSNWPVIQAQSGAAGICHSAARRMAMCLA